jgi:hypothetical protein
MKNLEQGAIKKLAVKIFSLVIINDFKAIIIFIFLNSLSGLFLECNNRSDNRQKGID